MCSQTTYQHMLAQIRDRIDKGYSAESAHAAVTLDWRAAPEDSCELFENALDYQTTTYRLED